MRRALLAGLSMALVALAGCGNLLGLSAPQVAIDATPGSDAAIDAPMIDAGPGTLHVVFGGTAGGSAGTIVSDPAGIACPGTCDFAFPPGQSVTLTATTTSGTFTGFHGGDCAGSGATCTQVIAGDATIYARWFTATNVVFVSSTSQAPGSFDSVNAADQKCQALADAAGVPGKFQAWLSTSAKSASQRLFFGVGVGNAASRWVRPDGALFVNAIQDLNAGRIQFPARLDEYGRDVGDDALAVTGTTAGGDAGGVTLCSDWASTSVAGGVLAGEPVGGTGRWTAVTEVTCATPTRVYCFSTVSSETSPIGPLGQAIVFVSKGTFAPGPGVSAVDADVMCTNEAAAAHLPNPATSALVTGGGGMSVSQRFIGYAFSGAVQRRDGVTLAPSVDQLFTATALPAAPNVAADGSYLDVDVWIGGGGFSDFQGDCTGWSHNSSSEFGASRPAATTRATTFVQQATCDQPKHVLCMNYLAAAAIR